MGVATGTAVHQPQPRLDADGLKREVGLLGLMWASEGSIIGSGWLFGSLVALTYAGPSALLGWVIASGIVILLALVHAELGGIFPVTGGTSRFPHYAFGSLAGGTFGWFAYIQAATVAPIEVLTTIQYFSTVSWANSWYKSPAHGATKGTLSGDGIAAAAVLMFVFVVINLVGIRWLVHANTTITSWKVVIPVLVIVTLLATHFHGGNFTAGGGFFLPGGFSASAKGIMVALPGAGIVFALLGFEQAVQLGGESARPQRDLPRAVIGSILIGATIYILLQFAFIAALNPATIANFHTWANFAKDRALEAGPFYTIAKVAALGWLAWILRVDAVVSPGGTGLIYLTSASRLSFGLSKNGYVPKQFESTTARTRIPVFGVIVTAVIGMLFLLPFSSWASLVDIVTGASVLMYAGAPLALGALRKSKPELTRSYRLPAAGIIAPLSFVLANFIVFWSGWNTVSLLMAVLLVGYILMALSSALHLNDHTPKLDWGAAVWIFPYLIGMTLISYFGSFGTGGLFGVGGVFKNVLVGGHGDLPLWWDLLTLGIFSLAIYLLAVHSRLPVEKVDEYVKDVFPPSLPVH
ncbi:MAG TPA: APC family permease [Acidimicrobiales bacterium]|nr:APC family permease [Acidimicrobiales bacterium]